jgi:hypothetical protein
MQENLEIINQVNEFYNSAWEKLILIGTIAFAIVGILVPFLIQWYQKKSMNLSEERLKGHIKVEVDKIKDALKIEMKEIFDIEVSKFEAKIEKIKNNSEAGIYHIQGTTELDKKDYQNALQSYITAAKFYVDAEDYLNLQIVLEVIEQSCLQNVKKIDFDNLKITSEDTLDSLFKKMQQIDNKGAFTLITNKIKLKVTNLQ